MVDAQDKVLAYGNWLGILQGTLTEQVDQGRQDLHARPERRPRVHRRPTASPCTLHGRSLLFVRNVGHLMTNPAILYGGGKEIPEGILDAVITTTIATARPEGPRRRRHPQLAHRLGLHRQAQDARPEGSGVRQRAVRPRRSSCSACPPTPSSSASWTRSAAPASTCKACIAEAAARVAFINTGFLDRTGDEMHTAMHAGPMLRKGDMKTSAWIQAYEKNNVLVGLACGLRGTRADRQGHVGHARPDGRDAGAEDRATRRPAPTPPGCPRPPPPRCTRCTTTRSNVAEVQKEMEKIDADAEREQLLAGLLQIPVVAEGATGPPPSASRSSTTTRRASWATWCAGSTRAWAAPRCPTSTTSA